MAWAAGSFASPSAKNCSASATDIAEHLADVATAQRVLEHRLVEASPSHTSQTVETPAITPRSV